MAEGEQTFVCPPHLPPREAWKVNPDTFRKFFAPTDDRGFVIPDATVEVVKSLFLDDYEWPIDFSHQETRPDVHHFQWLARRYDPIEFSGRTIPYRFRELPSMKGVVPRQFHNVIHAVTIPPSVPKYRDMAQHIDAYSSANHLHRSAENTLESLALFALRKLQVDSEDQVANDILISRFDRQFRGYQMNLERFLGLAGLEAFRLDDPKFSRRKPHEIAKLLAKVVRRREFNFVSEFKTAA